MNVRRLMQWRFLPTAVVFLALFGWPLVYANDYLVTTLMIAGIYSIMAIGVNLVNGQSGQGSMGHAAFSGIGAYATALLTVNFHWPPVLALVFATVLSAAVAYIIGRPVLRLKLWFLTMATLALVFIFQVVVINLRSVTGGTTGIAGIPWFSVGGITIISYKSEYYLIWAISLVVLIFCGFIMRARAGRALRALSVNEIAASSLGINTANWKLRVFVFSSALCGMAGGFYAFFLTSATPSDFSFNLVIAVLLMVMLGGQASLLGAVLGALVVTYAQYSFSSFQQYSNGLFGLLLVVVLLFLPNGLIGIPALFRSDKARRAGRLGASLTRLRTSLFGRGSGPGIASAGLSAGPVPATGSGAVATTASDQGIVTASGRTGAHDTTILVAPASATLLGARAASASPDADQSEPVIVIEDVTVDFGGLQAVSHVSLDMMPGTITAIIGPNGAGKTTLFNVLSGLQKASAGHVWFAGKDVTILRSDQVARLGMARTFQNLRIFHNMTVLDNVMTGRHQHESSHLFTAGVRWPSQRREERTSREAAMKVLGFVGLEHRADDQAASLPYGQQRLVEIARALATEPSLLLLDEPAAGMNQGERDVLVQKIKEISASGIKVILVEHNMGVVMGISHEVAVLDHGALICEGDPESVQCNPQVIEAYLGAGHQEIEVGVIECDEATCEVVGLEGTQASTTLHEVGSEEPASPADVLLEVRGVSTSYGAINAVRDVSLNVQQGEVLAILGANGAGKTTLMRTFSGILRPGSGHILFDGHDVTRMSPPRIVELGICQVPEGRHVFPTLSVYDNLALGAGRLHHKGAEFQEALDSVFELFPRLYERRQQAAGSLSGGEQQMLAVGRGLMAHPRLLMLDEPSMGLAPVVNAAIFESLRILNDRGLTLLMVEQNAEAALEIADRAIVLVTGEVALTGGAAELRSDPRIQSLYLGGGAD